ARAASRAQRIPGRPESRMGPPASTLRAPPRAPLFDRSCAASGPPRVVCRVCVRRTLALTCEAPAPTAIGAVLRQLQRLVQQLTSPPGRCQRGGRAGPTRVTNVNSLVPALAEISQQPSVGNMSPLAWNPVG